MEFLLGDYFLEFFYLRGLGIDGLIEFMDFDKILVEKRLFYNLRGFLEAEEFVLELLEVEFGVIELVFGVIDLL
jgi:hypothetical protein